MFLFYFQFSDICKDSSSAVTEPDLGAASDAASAEVTTQSPLPEEPASQPQFSDKPSGFVADFEDAADPLLLTSTLRTDANEDSDDEFDFDLPGSKVDNGKSVSFSGGGDGVESGGKAEEAAVSPGGEREASGLKLNTASEQAGAPAVAATAAAATVPDVSGGVTVKSGIPQVMIQPASPLPEDVPSDQVIIP